MCADVGCGRLAEVAGSGACLNACVFVGSLRTYGCECVRVRCVSVNACVFVASVRMWLPVHLV